MLVPVRQIGYGGIVTDVPVYDLPLHVFSDGQNVVFRDGKATKAKGWTSKAVLGGDAYWFHTWKDVDVLGTIYTVFGLDADIELYDGTSVTQPTHPALTASATDWQMDQFGKFPIINNGTDIPMYADTTDGSTWAVFPNWTTTFVGSGSVDIIRPFKSFLIALGVEGDKYTVYWSDESAPGVFPSDWDYTSTANLAGRNELPGADGQLVDGRQLGDSFIVYTDFAAYAMTLVGSTTFVFQFTRLFDRGLLNRDCVVEVENQHFCVGNSVIYTHDGSRITRVADNKVEQKFYNEIADSTKVYVTKDESNHEVMIYYASVASGGDTYTTKVVRWNWLENTWTFEDIGDGDDEVSHLAPSLRAVQATTYQDLIDDGRAYSDITETYAELAGIADDKETTHRLSIDVNAGGSTFWEAETTFQRDGTDYDAYLRKYYIDLDEVKGDTGRLTYVSAIYPQLTGSGSINIRAGGSMGPNDSISWAPTQSFDMDGSQYKIDTRITGRYLHLEIGEFSGAPTTNNWELSGLDLEVSDAGER